MAGRSVEAAVGDGGAGIRLGVVGTFGLAGRAAVVAGGGWAVGLSGGGSSAVLDGAGTGVVVPLASEIAVAGGLSEESLRAGGLARATSGNTLGGAGANSELSTTS